VPYASPRAVAVYGILLVYCLAGIAVRNQMMGVLTFVGVVAGLLLVSTCWFPSLRLAKRQQRSIAPEIGIAMVLIISVAGFTIAWQSIGFASPWGQPPSEPLGSRWAFLGAVIVMACFEEVYFRGVLLQRYLSRWPVGIAIGVSGFLFGLAHMVSLGVWAALPFFTIWGIGFGLVTFWRDGLLTVLLAHLVWNVLAAV
jgi:membrane protease YdiL (CAAX protease family)